jgi:AAA+ ATPase superfamily predicted ATPase
VLDRQRRQGHLDLLWFRFVYGHEDRYERMGDAAYANSIEPDLPDFVSPAFERLCQTALPDLSPNESFTDIGRWWYKEHEVDVVGLTTSGLLVAGECKFTNSAIVYSVLSTLEKHTDKIRWSPPMVGQPR